MLVTISEAAAALGHASRATLYRAMRDGRLTGYLRPGGRGGASLIEMEPPDLPPLREHLGRVVRWQSNTPEPPRGSAADRQPVPDPAPAADPAAVAAGLAAAIASLPEDQIPELGQSRARREHYQAELARLEALQRRGDLIPAADVRRQAFDIGRQVRDALRLLPSRLAPELAAATDTRAVHLLLTTEIDRALHGLAGD